MPIGAIVGGMVAGGVFRNSGGMWDSSNYHPLVSGSTLLIGLGILIAIIFIVGCYFDSKGKDHDDSR